MMSMILVKEVKKVKRATRTDFFLKKKFLFFLFCVRMQENFFIFKPFFFKKKIIHFYFASECKKKKFIFLKAFFKKQIILILFCVKMQNVFFVIIYS